MTARLHQLANGVRVLVDPMPGLETLAVSVVAGRGARAERGDQSGWAHLLEHMVFKGAGARSARQIAEAVEAAGGQINAATGYERTSFQIRALKGGLPLALEILSDLVLRPTFDPQELEREKKVIGQEIAEANDTPDDQVFELAQGRAFAGHALGRPILGETLTVDAADPGSLEAFRAAQYGAGELVVSVAGAADEDDLLRLAEAAFASARPGPAAVGEPAAFAGGSTGETRRLEQAHAVLLLPGVSARDPAYFTQRLFAEALGGGMSSRLFQEARERLGLAYAIDAYAEAYEDAGVLGVYVGMAAADAARTAEVVGAQIRALSERIEDDELARCKAQLKGALFMARESPLARAEQAAGQVLLFGAPYAPETIAKAVDAVGPADIAAYGAKVLGAGLAASAVLSSKAANKTAARFALAPFA